MLTRLAVPTWDPLTAHSAFRRRKGLSPMFFLVLTPLFGVPPVFGNLIEIGFEGGHGTVGGMESDLEIGRAHV